MMWKRKFIFLLGINLIVQEFALWKSKAKTLYSNFLIFNFSFLIFNLIITGCASSPEVTIDVKKEHFEDASLRWPYRNWDLQFPHGIAIDKEDNIYIADTNNHRICKFDKIGNFIMKLGGIGTQTGKFKFPYGVAVDSLFNIYVADTNT